jgi:hypothetical protein
MRSYFPDHDIGKSRIYTGYFTNVRKGGELENKVHAFVFVKAMRGTIVSNKDLSFPDLDDYYRQQTKWRTAIQYDEKKNRKILKQIAHNLTRLTAKD